MGALMTFLADTMGKLPLITDMPALNKGIDWLLVWMNGWVGNFAWTMIIFTIFLKLILFPLDYLSRRSMKRNSMIQEMLAPQLAKLEKQCKGDKTLYNQKMMLMMRKEGYKMAGACLPSIVTLVIFIFVFSALGNYTCYSNARIYNGMVEKYNVLVVEHGNPYDREGNAIPRENLGDYAEADVVWKAPEEVMNGVDVQGQLAEEYKKLNPRWLWIKNTIRPDGFNTAIPDFKEVTGDAIGAPGLLKYLPGEGEEKQENYEQVMGIYAGTNDKGETAVLYREGSIGSQYNDSGFKIFGKYLNGWFLLPLLAAGVSFLTQFLSTKMQGPQPGSGGGAMKVMMVVFPLMMLFFAVSYTSGFSLYIITNSLCTLGGSYAANWIAGKTLKKHFEKKRLEKKKTSYSR